MTRAAFGRRRLLGVSAGFASLVPLAACGLFDDDVKPITPGHREDVLPQQAGLELDPDLANLPVTIPPAEANASWPQPGRVPVHVLGNFAWSGAAKSAWETRIGLGQALRSQLTAPPLVADGRIFTMDAAAVIDCFDLASGKRIWHLESRPKKVRSSNVGGGITYDAGTIYAATGLAEALAIDAATGKVRWRAKTGTPVRSLPTVDDGRLYFGTIDEKLFALDASDGKPLWNYQATQSFNALLGQPAPAVSNRVVVAGFGSGELAAVNAVDGSIVWTDALGGTTGASPLEFASIKAEPVIAGNTVYAISAGGLMTATDMRTGRRIWERPVAGSFTPVLAGDWLFMVTTEATVACLQLSTGHVRWTSVLPRFHKPKSRKQPIAWAGPLLAGDKLLFVSSYGMMALMDPADGSIVDQRKLRAPASQVPIVADGTLLVLTDDGWLTAYR